MVRLAVARLRCCSNSFTPRRTRSEDVSLHEWMSGDNGMTRASGTGTEIDGVTTFAAAHPDWEITLLRSASAPAGGPLSGNVFHAWLSEIEAGLKRGRFDAIYVSLHGACQAEGDPAADLTVLRRIRAVMGPRPVVASFDIRANMSEEIAILLDGATSNVPDQPGSEADAANRALILLARIIAGEIRPMGALARLPQLVDGSTLDAAVELALSGLRERMRSGPLVEASLFTGFAWGDSPSAGPSALVWADRDSGAARQEAASLALSLSRSISMLRPEIYSSETAIKTASTIARPGQPALVLDPADDPGSGGLLDTPEILRDLQRAQAFGQLNGPCVLAALHDVETVSKAHSIGIGGTLSGSFGARTTQIYGQAVPLSGEVVGVGQMADANDYAVIRSGQIDILFLARRPAMIDPALLAACGIDLRDTRVLAIKGGVKTGEAFGNLVIRCTMCDTPGPTSPDLQHLPYSFVPAIRRMTQDDDAELGAESGGEAIRRPTDRRTRAHSQAPRA